MNIEQTLSQRKQRYGLFISHAELSQELKRSVHDHIGWDSLTDDKREAIDMIMHKIARILCGDPDYKDSWHDIVGYAKLIDDSLSEE